MTRPVRFILECAKTGRFWTYATESMARRAAMHLGVTDYTITREQE